MRILLSAILLSITLFLVHCNTAIPKQPSAQSTYQVLTLQPTNIELPREYICEIDAEQYVEIRARVQGYLEAVFVDEGQWVKKDQPLFRLSSYEYQESVTRAEANLQRSIAEAKTNQLEVDRLKILVDKDVISKTELEVAIARKDAATSAIREAQSVLQNAKINLGYTLIRAPFTGVIDRLPFKRGSLINTGTLLTSVSKVDEVFAYFRVSEREYLDLLGKEIRGQKFNKDHQRVSLVLANQTEYPHEGYVETIEGDIDRATGTLAFRARFPNPKFTLKHGSSGKIQMKSMHKDAVLIPQESAFTIQDQYYVFQVDDNNTVHAHNFSMNGFYKDHFVVTGLEAGDRIVANGIQQLRDGQVIRPAAILPDSSRISKL